VRLEVSLPWVRICRAFCVLSVVLVFFAVRLLLITRQRLLCRATAHGRVYVHDSPSFSGSGSMQSGNNHSRGTNSTDLLLNPANFHISEKFMSQQFNIMFRTSFMPNLNHMLNYKHDDTTITDQFHTDAV
jgi:hypothetical protein